MRFAILREEGYDISMFGLGLSHGVTAGMSFEEFIHNIDVRVRVDSVALKLAPKGGGHNKFLESMQIWLDLDIPRYMWSEFDTYRVGTSKQSESSMHTIQKEVLDQYDFEYPINPAHLEYINDMILRKESIEKIKNELPEGFLQRREVSTNYQVLRNIYHQRKGHKLQVWRNFCVELIKRIEHPEFITEPQEHGVG